MVDPVTSSLLPAGPASTALMPGQVQSHPEPAVQVTRPEAGRNGTNTDDGARQQSFKSHTEIHNVFEDANTAMQAWATGMRFEIDEDTHPLVVSVIDAKSGDVLRQIPSEEILHVAKMITRLQGKLIDVKA